MNSAESVAKPEPRPLTPKQIAADRRKRAKDLLKRYDDLRSEGFALLDELDMWGPDGQEIRDALYHGRDGYWMLERTTERVKA